VDDSSRRAESPLGHRGDEVERAVRPVFSFGAWIGVRITLIPSARNISSKA
jgi:hypothetical protein